MKTLLADTFPFFLGKLNTWAEENDGHLAAKKLTWADLYFVALHKILILMTKNPDIYSEYPALLRVVENVESIDSIKKWIAERPVTDM
jgi:prostaglandin-H2 D-isomerase / glutathione transferase